MVLPLGLGVDRLLPEEREPPLAQQEKGDQGGPGCRPSVRGAWVQIPFMFWLSSPPTPLLPAREMLKKEQPLTLRSALARRADCFWSDMPTVMTVFW